MAYFPDLSDYVYFEEFALQNTQNIGWLDESHYFETTKSSEKVLETIWQYCKVAVATTRGVHPCAFCSNEHSERNGEKLLLGTAEIRVFGTSGTIFAAPNLIYHYILAHDYLPPATFLDAIQTDPKPPDPLYLEKLTNLNLEWEPAPKPSPFGSMGPEDYPLWKKLNVTMMEYLQMRLDGTLPEDI